MLSSCPSVAFCLLITIHTPTWILVFLSAFFLLAALSSSLSGTATDLPADAKTGCMHQATKQTCKHKIFFILGIHVVSSKSQDTVIASACEAFFLYHGHKRAPKLPGVHVSSVKSLNRTYKTCQTLNRT